MTYIHVLHCSINRMGRLRLLHQMCFVYLFVLHVGSSAFSNHHISSFHLFISHSWFTFCSLVCHVFLGFYLHSSFIDIYNISLWNVVLLRNLSLVANFLRSVFINIKSCFTNHTSNISTATFILFPHIPFLTGVCH